MNSETTTELFPFAKAPTSTVKQACPEQRRRVSQKAQPPEKWSLRVDLPVVRETLRNASGGPVSVRTPADIAKLCEEFRQSAQEVLIAVDLNTRNHVIDKRLVSLGILDASLFHCREIFRGAVQLSSAALVVVHTHPSGDPTPSTEDIRITRQLVEAGKILGIKVLDHVVLGREDPTRAQSFCSLRESGLVSFEA